ncbi:MAG: SIMPL domain-containing protein [Candidatus Micrarchaeota archaeon]|nr:SIMPL domain-containing protein [Candidatus Micrarchaeota archaeon]
MATETNAPCCSHGGGMKSWIMLALFVILTASFAYMAVKPSPGNEITIGNLTASQLEKTISVSADARRSVNPDLLTIQFSIETLNKTAKESQSENAARMDSVLNALKSNGIKNEDIETTSYNIYPEYDTNWVCPDAMVKCEDIERVSNTTLKGYRTVQSVAVNVKDLNSGGDMLDLIIDSGANRIDSVYFSLKDSTRKELEMSLLQEASENAKLKAQRVALGLGSRLGDAVSASTSYYYTPIYSNYVNMAKAESSGAAVSTPISSGQIDVSVSMNAAFEMK